MGVLPWCEAGLQPSWEAHGQCVQREVPRGVLEPALVLVAPGGPGDDGGLSLTLPVGQGQGRSDSRIVWIRKGEQARTSPERDTQFWPDTRDAAFRGPLENRGGRRWVPGGVGAACGTWRENFVRHNNCRSFDDCVDRA